MTTPIRQLFARRNQINYTGLLHAPVVDWLQNLTVPAQALLEAFGSYGFGVESLQILGAGPAAAQHAVQMLFGFQGSYTVKLDRCEAAFYDLDEKGMVRAVQLLADADQALRRYSKMFKMKSHQITYSVHASIDGGRAIEVLRPFVATVPKTGGSCEGNGFSFRFSLPQKGWQTTLTLEMSQVVVDGLFIYFVIHTGADRLDFPQLLVDGRSYLRGVLQELGFWFPDPTQAAK